MKNEFNLHYPLIIRNATPDDAPAIAPLLLMAMEDIIYRFTDKTDSGFEFMLHFVSREHNQYSWQNCIVAEEDGKVVAAVNLYEGTRLRELRQPVIDHLNSHYNRNVIPEDETDAGEIYIDTLGVVPEMQGRGIGTRLLQYIIDEYQRETLGILADEDNPDATRLYLKLGFMVAGTKTLMGKKMVHLRYHNH
jgi:ribosomal protein S18 acetylase RimI-like enzyme